MFRDCLSRGRAITEVESILDINLDGVNVRVEEIWSEGVARDFRSARNAYPNLKRGQQICSGLHS